MNLTTSIARKSDPQSSHSAAEEVSKSGTRQAQCLAVLELVRKYPGRTSLELARLSWKEAQHVDRYTVSRRLPELERSGMVRRGDERDCSINGRPMLTWWPVDLEEPEQLRLEV